MADITAAEFERWMEVLRNDIQGVHARLDTLNGRTRASETAIAVLQDRATQAKDPAARWTALGSALAAILAGALAWFHKP